MLTRFKNSFTSHNCGNSHPKIFLYLFFYLYIWCTKWLNCRYLLHYYTKDCMLGRLCMRSSISTVTKFRDLMAEVCVCVYQVLFYLNIVIYYLIFPCFIVIILILLYPSEQCKLIFDISPVLYDIMELKSEMDVIS